MLRVRDYTIIVGGLLLVCGMVCLPVGQEANPKRALGVFDQVADHGTFLDLGWRLIPAGLAVIISTLIIASIADRSPRDKPRHLAKKPPLARIIP